MPETHLVAGAAGGLGRQVVWEAARRGHRVRALVHRTQLPEDLAAVVTEYHRCDALDPSQLKSVCDGVDVVFSCLGASVLPSFAKGRRPYTSVDTPANRNLIDAARGAGVQKFVYVGVLSDGLGHLDYVRAHEQVVAALATSGLDYVVVRPTGFFSAFGEFLPMAARGPVPLVGDGSAKTNPIHDADLASVCLDAAEGQEREIEVGGPETLTRREIVEQAFHALGKRVRVLPTPPAGLLRRARAPKVWIHLAVLELFRSRPLTEITPSPISGEAIGDEGRLLVPAPEFRVQQIDHVELFGPIVTKRPSVTSRSWGWRFLPTTNIGQWEAGPQ